MKTNLCSRIIWRIVCFVLVLGLSGYIISKVCVETRQSEKMVGLEYGELHNKTLSGIKTIGKLLHPLNASAVNLARVLSSSLNDTKLSVHILKTKVAQELFLTLSMNPHMSQVSYIGLDGKICSIYGNDDHTVAMFSNSSSSSWYTQPLNRDSGNLDGDAVVISSSTDTVNASWFQEALKSTSGFSWLGKGWDNDQDNLFFSAAPIEGKGVVSLGVPTKIVADHFAALDFRNEDFHLATVDGTVVIQTKLPNTNILVKNYTVSVQMVNPNGGFMGDVGKFYCQSDDSESRHFYGKVGGKRYMFSCSALDIVGVHSVYVLAYPIKGLPSFVHEKSHLSLVLLVLLFLFITISICVFLFFIIRAARREMILCASLVKQMDATQQAERKSMNKTTAFNRANHDVRASLVAVSALVGCCHNDARPNSELASNLAKIKAGVDDLHGILNSFLDTSKIEAGKMQLEEKEFNLAQLLEDVVDMYYHVAIQKGVDVVFDPSDDSVTKSCLVRGDRGKLKQILCNLLSNAVKFTREGHITVRATVKKASLETAIIASNSNVVVKCLSRLWCKNKQDLNDLNALQTTHQDPNLREFVIEVDDTGKGIPKDLQKSVFENFVQVTQRDSGQEGTGLGLGIVQSLVRLMGGDIRILDKEPGEKGTCFNFSVKLPICEPEVAPTEEEHPSNRFRHFSLLRGHAPKHSGSRVVLFLANDERRKILTKYIESLNIEVSNVEGNTLMPHLEKIKSKLNLSYFSHSEKSQLSSVESFRKSESINSESGANIEGTSCTKDETDNVSSPYKKSNSKGSLGIILVVIDSSADVSSELESFLANFRKDIHSSKCKIVWLGSQSEETSPACPYDYVIPKPFHGSRLYQVLGLIPELKKCNFPKLTMEARIVQEIEQPTNNDSERMEHEAETTSSSQQNPELQQILEEPPLSGKKVLVVEDVKLLRKITTATLVKLGAEVEECENGVEAYDRICKHLGDHDKAQLYHCIFMDCEMPIMNGYEATRLIRKEEQQYEIHIPIIALTAHAIEEEVNKTISAGMDLHLTKPLQVDKIMEVLKLLT